MACRHGLLRCLAVISLMVSSSVPSSLANSPTDIQRLVPGNTAFAVDLYARIARTPGNVFFSPYSVSTCLALAYAGARGQTESQMARVLHFPDNQSQTHAGFGALRRQLGEVGNQAAIQLDSANALWAERGQPFAPDFLKIAKSDYQANIEQADFKSSAEAVTQEINRWVSQQTKDKIQNLIPPGSLDSQTRLVLANAVYFKGIWARKFDQPRTVNQPFRLLNGGQVNAPLMHAVEEVGYMKETDFEAVELPYRSNLFSMVILLPRQTDGCGALEQRLTPALVSNSVAEMKKQKVEIFLPRFRLQSSLQLKRALVEMGMTDAFGSKADFSGMDETHQLSISAVFHQSWGEVNEEGTEAAAATAAGIHATAVIRPPQPPSVFKADHPFLFFIRDTRSGALLFLGRLENPQQQ